MTMRSYFSATADEPIQRATARSARAARPESAVRARVVVTDEGSPPVGDHPIVGFDAHLEAELQARSLQLERPHERPDLVAILRRRAVRDVALGEDEAEGARRRGHVFGRERREVFD